MKFVLALVALASVAAVNAAPGTFFGDTPGLEKLEGVQIANRKIEMAGDDIDITEGRLKNLVAQAAEIKAADKLVTDTATVEAYRNDALEFKHETA
jgi:hypothetical protein